MGEAPLKKEGLRLAQLASYDDFLTDALVDRVYFWATIRKNRNRYTACRGIREEEIANILRQHVIVEKDPGKACLGLLELTGIKRYFERLSPDEKEHFQRHLRKYVNIYMPDCPFEVSTTNRYTIDTQEAAATARRTIRKGELIKYLSGIQVAMTREEEKEFDLDRRDFSIVMSSRKRTPSLFLGPARFANHDCDANARLTTKGPNGMTVVAAKDIAVGDEITVSYGNDYFGLDNCECLCGTCEDLHRNGWAPFITRNDDDTSVDGSVECPMSDAPYESPRKRPNTSISRTLTPEQPQVSSPTRKCETLLQVPSSPQMPMQHPRLEDLKSRGSIRRSSSCLSQELRLSDADEQQLGETPGRSTSPSSVVEGSQQGSQSSGASTAATSLSENASVPEERDSDATVEPSETIAEKISSTEVMPEIPEINAHSNVPVDAPHSDESASELSDVPEELEFDDDSRQLVKKKVSQQPRITRHALAQLSRLERATLRTSESPMSPAPPAGGEPNPRKPGDYTLTKRLLSTSYSRWVQCRVCDSDFIQREAYQTRWSCPRCERHSKLYGYQWPKTDKTGKQDTEERILDHRTVHRFVWADEERTIKKKEKTVTGMPGENSSQHAGESEMDSSAVVDNSPRKSRERVVEQTGGGVKTRPRKRLAQLDGPADSPPRKRLKIDKAQEMVSVANPEKRGRRTVQLVSTRNAPRSSEMHSPAKRSYNRSGRFVGRWANTAAAIQRDAKANTLSKDTANGRSVRAPRTRKSIVLDIRGTTAPEDAFGPALVAVRRKRRAAVPTFAKTKSNRGLNMAPRQKRVTSLTSNIASTDSTIPAKVRKYKRRSPSATSKPNHATTSRVRNGARDPLRRLRKSVPVAVAEPNPVIAVSLDSQGLVPRVKRKYVRRVPSPATVVAVKQLSLPPSLPPAPPPLLPEVQKRKYVKSGKYSKKRFWAAPTAEVLMRGEDLSAPLSGEDVTAKRNEKLRVEDEHVAEVFSMGSEVGVRKRPIRRASLGVKAAVAAAGESDGDDTDLVGKNRRRLGRRRGVSA